MPQDKLPVPQFAAKIKAKYPQYKDIDDTVLVQKILAKYPEYNEQVDMTEVVKKKGGTDLSMVGGKATPSGGQVGSSKAQYGGLTDYSLKGVEQYAEQYNKQFEDATGHREVNLNAPTKPKSILSQQTYEKKKGAFELKKMEQYRDIEENKIKPVQIKVATGEVKPSELSELYNNPFGKKIVSQLINDNVPELGSTALESDVYGNEQKWADIAQAINVKNIGVGVDLNLQAIQGIDDYLNTTMQSGQAKKGYAGSVSPTTGVVTREAGSELLPLGKYNVNDPKDLSKFLQEVSKSDEILGADGGKKKLVESIKEKLFFIKTQEPIDQEIESANIPDAVARVNMRLEKGRQNVKYNDKVNELHFKLGLNYVKDSDPALYANVMRTITELGDIPDKDYEGIASLGQDIYNKKIHLQSATNPELVGQQTDIKYTSYQSEKQKYSEVLSETIKKLGYGNKGRVPTKAIEEAWKLHPELDNAEIVNDIAKDEAAGGYGIVKSGGLNRRMNAIAEPFKDLNRFYNSIVDSPAETYYNSRRLDYGDQQMVDAEGNIIDRLPSEKYGTFDKILDGAAKIASQVLITRGVGGLMKAPIAFGLGQVPRAAMTANQAKGIVNVGGTFASTYLQTYGNSYIDFLNKTGDPDKAALMATFDSLGTAALETFISPDVKIADKAAELLKSKKIDFVKDLTKVIEGNGGKVAAGQVVKKFVSEAGGIMGGQILQEDLQQIENFLVEGIFSPRTVEDRNLVKELINTTKETALATVIPAILGGGGATKAQRKLSREGLHTIAINFDSYKEAMDKAVLDGLMSQSDYDLASGIIQRHKSNIDNAPHRDAKGGLISADRQLEYAFQSTVEQIYGERAAQQPDNVQREPLEEKIKEAEQIKRKIFLGEEVKGLPKEEKVDEVDEKSVEEARLLEIADQALNNVAPIAGTDGNVMAIDGGNLLERAVGVWGTEDVRKGVELSLEKQLQQNRDELSQIENPTEGDREYYNEVEQEIRQKHKEALAKIEQLKEVGKPEGYELPGQPKVEAGSVGVGGDVDLKGDKKQDWMNELVVSKNKRKADIQNDIDSFKKDESVNKLVKSFDNADDLKGFCDTLSQRFADKLVEEGVDAKDIQLIEGVGLKNGLDANSAKALSDTEPKYISHVVVKIGDNVIDLSGKQFGDKYSENVIPYSEFKKNWNKVKDWGWEHEQVKKIKFAIELDKYQKAISEGRMTATDAKKIIESAGLEVPKDIAEQSIKEQPKSDIDAKKEAGSVGVEGDVVVGAKPKPIDEQSIAASQKWIKDLYSLPDLTRIQDKNGNIYDIKGGKIRKLTLDKEGNVINAEIIHTDRDVHKRGAYSNPDFFNEGYRVLPEQSPKEQPKASTQKSDIDAKKEAGSVGLKQTNNSGSKYDSFDIIVSGEKVGVIDIDKGDTNSVHIIDISPEFQGKGVAGIVYEQLAEKYGELSSSKPEYMEDNSIKVWDKLVKKGVAVKNVDGSYIIKLTEQSLKEQPQASTPKSEIDTKGKGQSKDKGVLSHLHSAKNIPEESRNGFEREGLKYETKSQPEAERVADSIIDKYGVDEAVSMAERMMFDGDVNSLIFGKALNILSEQESKATTEEEKMAAAERFAEVGIAYDKLARYGGRFNAAINYFYKKSPLGIILMENAKRKEEFDDWAKNKEKSWKEAIKDPEFEKLFKEKVEEQLKTERTETRKAKREKVHKAIDDTMAKWAKKFSANLPEGTEKAGASIDVFKAAAATMKAAYDAGEAIGKVIQDAIDYISKETGVNDWDKEGFRTEWAKSLTESGSKKALTDEELKAKVLEKFRKKLKGLTEKQKDKVIQKSYNELIENGALDFDDLRDIIAEVIGKKELTKEEQARMKELVNKVNSIEKAAEAVRTERTQEARDRFREVQKEASFASKELSTMFYNKPDIIKRLNSIMILGTLGPVSLVVNITYNIWNQLALRLFVGAFNTLVDLALTRSAKLAGSEIHQEYNIIKGQAEFWSKLGTGLKESFEQIKTGLNRMDYTQKEVYQESIRPFDSLKDLWKNAKGETNLTRSQWWDKFIQGFPLMGMYAEGVARALNIGDKPQRFAAQGAQAASFAKGLGLKGIDYDIFIDFPRAEAYRVYKALGKTDEEAMTEADVVERAIVREGERATFQQDNLLNDKLSQLFGGKNSGIGGAIKSLAVSPYVKIPSNAFWSYYNLINPEVAAVQSAYLFKKAHDLRQKNEMADARMSAREARYWLAHMVVGMSMRAVVLSMVKSGMFVPASDEDDSKKEREAMSLYDRGGTVNIGGVKVANKWFAQFGMMGNAIAKKYQDMTPEQKENQETFWNTIFGGMEADALKELENGIFANSSSLLQWYSTGKPDRYLMNTINLLSNILQPAGIAQINRARIDYVTSAQGDTFMQKLNQNFAQRSTLYRNIFDVQLKYKRDIWGQKIPKEGNTLSRMFGISKDNPKIFARPVYNDYLRTMDAGFLPPIAPMKLNDKALTTEQYEKLQNYVGAARIAYIEPYVNGAVKAEGFNEKYSEMSDSRKKFALSYWYDKGLKVGKEKFYKEYPELIPAKEDVDYVEEVEKDIFRTLQNLK